MKNFFFFFLWINFFFLRMRNCRGQDSRTVLITRFTCLGFSPLFQGQTPSGLGHAHTGFQHKHGYLEHKTDADRWSKQHRTASTCFYIHAARNIFCFRNFYFFSPLLQSWFYFQRAHTHNRVIKRCDFGTRRLNIRPFLNGTCFLISTA